MMMNLMTVLVKKVFISSKPSIVCLLCPPPCGPFSIQESAVGGLSYKVKKGIFRLCSLETKNSAVPLCFRIPNPALRRVTCAIRTLLMPSASQNLLPDALSAQTCGDCSANGIPSLAPSICILFPFHAFSNLFISAISQMLRLWQFATSRSICTTIIRIKNFLLFVKGCRCFCSACAE